MKETMNEEENTRMKKEDMFGKRLSKEKDKDKLTSHHSNNIKNSHTVSWKWQKDFDVGRDEKRKTQGHK